jgi:hypothetical protein
MVIEIFICDTREALVVLDKHFINVVVLPNYAREGLTEDFGPLPTLEKAVNELCLNLGQIFWQKQFIEVGLDSF